MNDRRLYKDFTVSLANGKIVTAEMSALVVYEPDYGSDADGNRGTPMRFIEDVDMEEAWLLDDEGQQLTHEEMDEASDLLFKKAELDDWEGYDDDDFGF